MRMPSFTMHMFYSCWFIVHSKQRICVRLNGRDMIHMMPHLVLRDDEGKKTSSLARTWLLLLRWSMLIYISRPKLTRINLSYTMYIHKDGMGLFDRPKRMDVNVSIHPRTARVSLSPCTFQLFRGQYLAEIGGRPMAGQWPDGISQLWRPFQTCERCLASLGVGSYSRLPYFPRDVPKYFPNSLRPSEFFSHTWDPWSLWESPSPCPGDQVWRRKKLLGISPWRNGSSLRHQL